jgi:hypothetical protein
VLVLSGHVNAGALRRRRFQDCAPDDSVRATSVGRPARASSVSDEGPVPAGERLFEVYGTLGYYLEDILRLIGKTDLTARSHYADARGRVRVVVPHTGWEEYLLLATTEGIGGPGSRRRRLRVRTHGDVDPLEMTAHQA